MVINYRSVDESYQLLKLVTISISSEIPFWAAAPKGQCPVGHRGEFPDVRPSVRTYFHPSVLPSPTLTIEASN